MINIEKGDFVELKYTGYANGKLFDSNIPEELKKIDSSIAPKKVIVVVGEEMVVKGLDNALIGKEIGKEYEIIIQPKDGFGERKRDYVKTIPLAAFKEKNVNPYPGMVLTLDNIMVRIITVSGARVVTDFNNPLSGKVLHYKFIITRKVTDEKEKIDALFEGLFKFIPEYEIKEKVIIKGPRGFEIFVKSFNAKFKELIGKELGFEEKKIEEKKKEEKGEKDIVADDKKVEEKL